MLALTLLPGSANNAAVATLWGNICGPNSGSRPWSGAVWVIPADKKHLPPVAACQPLPSGYHTLSSVGAGGDTRVSFDIGYDQDSHRLCFVATGLPEAPVLRVGVGHTLSIEIANTLHDTFQTGEGNVECAIDSFGGEGICPVRPIFPEAPGPDGSFYPLMANEAHTADGTSNLHVHGLFVPPVVCGDEVLTTAIYPANWRGAASLQSPCQSAPDRLTYTYHLPADHPAGVYWYHTHRHGQAEHQTQMGLVGAIVVEDKGDAHRASIGVTDEVLLVTDTPILACTDPISCDVKAPSVKRRQGKGQAVRPAANLEQATFRAAAGPVTASGGGSTVVLDPRIDQVNQAGECAEGASDSQGGYELWTLLLNGAPVPEALNGFPPDSELLTKNMQPGQRQIFRLVNASANSFLAPQLVLVQNGVETALPLEVFARDGVGFADGRGTRHFASYDVTQNQFVVPPAGRVEFVVHAPPAGAKLYLQSSQVLPGCGGNLYPARRLLLITPAGTPVSPGAADDSDLLVNTPSLAPYLSTLGAKATVHRTLVLSEYGRGFTYGVTKWPKAAPTAADYDPSQTDFFITEVASDDGEVKRTKTAVTPFVGANLAPQVVVHLHGQQSVTEEWLVENSTLEIHAFHMHQIHFRDITAPGDNPDDQPLLDTIDLPAAPLIGDVATGYPGAPGWVKLRMTFTTADIGEFVFHCHILEHEDNGMMGKIQVVAD
jgi:FtsP/CotA-like multicopper oxidase with cupredoxin domain